MYGLGFENKPLGVENCMSSKSENLKLLDPLQGCLPILIGIDSPATWTEFYAYIYMVMNNIF